MLSLVNQTEDAYHRGMLYAGLVHYRKKLSILSDDAKSLLADHIAAELNRYLAGAPLSPDSVNNLELIADVSCYFANDAVFHLLYRVLELGYNNVNFYLTSTLLALGADVPSEVIASLAQDLEYANLTYGKLKAYGKEQLFPQNCSSPEYLAKSDMVHWLMYPTELGQAPDEIEYIGKITYLFKMEVYHVFRYRSGR